MELEFHEFLVWNSSSLKIFKWNSSSTNLSSKNLSSLNGTRVPKFLFYFFKVSFCYNLIVQKSRFTLKLDFLKIEFQNRDISLNSFRQWVFFWKFCEKWVKPHFGLTYDIYAFSGFVAYKKITKFHIFKKFRGKCCWKNLKFCITICIMFIIYWIIIQFG